MKAARYSYGVCCIDFNKKKTLLVQRRDTAEFLHLMRGFYKEKDINFIVSKCTKSEFDLLEHMVNSDDQAIDNIMTSFLNTRYKYNVNYLIINGIRNFKANKSSIARAVYNNLPVKHHKYLWPKGGIRSDEDPLSCAKRELEEESSVNLPIEQILTINYKVDIKSFTGKLYRTIYYLAIVDSDEYPVSSEIDKREIQKAGWYTFDQALELLESPYRDMMLEIMNL